MRFMPKTLLFKFVTTGEVVPASIPSFSVISLHNVLLELLSAVPNLVLDKDIYSNCCTKCFQYNNCEKKDYLQYYKGYTPIIMGVRIPGHMIKETLSNLNLKDGDTVCLVWEFPYCSFSYSYSLVSGEKISSIV